MVNIYRHFEGACYFHIWGEVQVLKAACYFENSLLFYPKTLRQSHDTFILNVLDISYFHFSSNTIDLPMKTLTISCMSIISESLILLFHKFIIVVNINAVCCVYILSLLMFLVQNKTLFLNEHWKLQFG